MKSIEWTDATWNPIRGCSPVSPGCAHCYAAGFARRLSADGMPYAGESLATSTGKWTGKVVFDAAQLEIPIRWKKARRVFVNSMSDLFHQGVRKEEIASVFGVMAACARHTYQVLTKRPDKALHWFQWLELHTLASQRLGLDTMCQQFAYDVLEKRLPLHPIKGTLFARNWPLPNVHLIASVEDAECFRQRVGALLLCPASVHGISFEPLLGDVGDIDFMLRPHPSFNVRRGHVGWVIIGPENGPGRRPCELSWVRNIVDQAQAANVPVFVKALDLGHRVSRDPSEWPEDLRVRMHAHERWVS